MTEWKLGKGTGNAKCRICNQIITEEQCNIKLVNSRVSGQIHSNPFECSDERQIQLGYEPIGEEIEIHIESDIEYVERINEEKEVKE